MKNLLILLFLSLPVLAISQLITEEELILMVKDAQDECAGAHENIIMRANEGFANTIWGQKVRINGANIIKFFSHTSGEKVSPGFDIYANNKGKYGYTYDPGTASDLLKENGVRVSQSYNQPWINAKQNLLYAESTKEDHKISMELYCPYQEFLDLLRIGKAQSLEFLITGFSGSASSGSKIYGVLTRVNSEKLTIKCSNGHEFDQATGYKFCPECGEPLE